VSKYNGWLNVSSLLEYKKGFLETPETPAVYLMHLNCMQLCALKITWVPVYHSRICPDMCLDICIMEQFPLIGIVWACMASCLSTLYN